MKQIDVFNGDADGICGLQQLRLAQPCASQLVTGVKRDIELLDQVQADAQTSIAVLDISLDKNRAGLLRVLEQGARVAYFDHHFAGDLPQNKRLALYIDTSPETCTALIVNQHLKGAFARWALVGAYGDSMLDPANRLADQLGLSAADRDACLRLGTCINYNAYGESVADLHFAPDDLFRRLQPYRDPLEFIAGDRLFNTLEEAYQGDMAKAAGLKPVEHCAQRAVYVLPCEAWARRVSGVFANQLAEQNPARAHALLTRLADGAFVVSVRAPQTNKAGADTLCRQFPTGGGRKGAAGINHLPQDQFDAFVAKFREAYP